MGAVRGGGVAGAGANEMATGAGVYIIRNNERDGGGSGRQVCKTIEGYPLQSVEEAVISVRIKRANPLAVSGTYQSSVISGTQTHVPSNFNNPKHRHLRLTPHEGNHQILCDDDDPTQKVPAGTRKPRHFLTSLHICSLGHPVNHIGV